MLSKKHSKSPNIIFILIDDLGWRDLGCYGSDFYETAHIDRMAKQGVLFTDAYASAPICSPTRASILTGKYPARLGMTHYIGAPQQERGKLLSAPYVDHLPLSERCLPKYLREQGYQTWHVGKWHLGPKAHYPEYQGFDVNAGGCSWGHPQRGYYSPYGIETLEDGPEGEYLTDRLTDEAIKLIRTSGDQPYFLHLAHYTVHTPIQAKQEDIQYYTEKAKKLGLDKVQALEEGEFFPAEHKKGKRVTRRLIQSDPVYAAMIHNMDQNIGRLLEVIRELGQEQETLIIFTSDNGGLATSEGSPTCNKPLHEGKGWMYEGGLRVPLIVHWPGVIKEGKTVDQPVTSPDFYPTILEAAELPLIPEQHQDGISFLSLLSGEKAYKRFELYWHFPHYGNQGGTPGSSIRQGDYKLIHFFEDESLELYNLREDIEERKNLMATETHRAEQMLQLLQKWQVDVEVRLPSPLPNSDS